MKQNPNTTHNELIAIGYLGSPHGIKGGLCISSYTTPFEIAFELPCFILDTELIPLDIASLEAHHKKHVVYINGVADRNAAQNLVGKQLVTNRDAFFAQFPEQYYFSLCEGYQVIDADNSLLGTLLYVDLIDDLPMADIDSEPHALKRCFLADYIDAIDHANKTIILAPTQP